MSNDLISRSALKEEVKGLFCPDGFKLDFIRTIDNAPTVEEKSYAMGYQDGAEDGLDGIIPQGEWITHQTGMLLWEECNQCHAQVGTIGMNFCPNCGADMRKGGVNNG